MSKRQGWLVLCTTFCVLLFAGTANADNVIVTAGITSFRGVVLGSNVTNIDWCGTATCSGPGQQVCPDIVNGGCAAGFGEANLAIGLDPATNTTATVVFQVAGNPPANALSFTANSGLNGAPMSVDPTAEFKLGSLTFANGLWSGPADFGFSIFANDTTTGVLHTFTGFLHLDLTPNSITATPDQNADFVYLTNASGTALIDPLTNATLPSLRAYELTDSPNGSNTVTADLYGVFGSLDPTRFANATGGGFLDTSLTTTPGGPPTNQMPEPATIVLLLAGLLSISGSLRKNPLGRSSGD
jgi:hypothetical protein